MVPTVSGSSGSISQDINADIQFIDELLNDIEKKEGKKTTQQVLELLEAYINKMMKGDIVGAGQVQSQLTTVVGSLCQDVEAGKEFIDQLKALASNPNDQTTGTLAMLQSIIAFLKQALNSLNS